MNITRTPVRRSFARALSTLLARGPRKAPLFRSNYTELSGWVGLGLHGASVYYLEALRQLLGHSNDMLGQVQMAHAGKPPNRIGQLGRGPVQDRLHFDAER